MRECRKESSQNLTTKIISSSQTTTMGTSSSKAAGKYDDYDWKELPENVRVAAEKLGYTKKIWDKDLKLQAEELDWAELTPDQQEAAKTLGYTKKLWEEN